MSYRPDHEAEAAMINIMVLIGIMFIICFAAYFASDTVMTVVDSFFNAFK